MKNPKFTIPQPCTKSWETMKPCGTNSRHCEVCNKVVFDIRDANQKQITQLYKQKQGNICVVANTNQLHQRKHWLKKAGVFAALLVTPILFHKLQAQNKPGTYKIVQTNKVSDSIRISGIVKKRNEIRWKKIDTAIDVEVFINGEAYYDYFFENTHGRFELYLPATIQPNAKITLTVSAEGYQGVTIANIAAQPTYLKIFADEQKFVRGGRFF